MANSTINLGLVRKVSGEYKPEVNALYGPYSDLTTGANTVYNTLGALNIPEGLTIAVGTGANLKEWWYTGAFDNYGFSLKNTGEGSGTSQTLYINTSYSVTLDNDYIILDDDTSNEDVADLTIVLQAFNGQNNITPNAIGEKIYLGNQNTILLNVLYLSVKNAIADNYVEFQLNRGVGLSGKIPTGNYDLPIQVVLGDNITYTKTVKVIVKDFSAGEIYQIITSPNILAKDNDGTLLNDNSESIQVNVLQIEKGSHTLVNLQTGNIYLKCIKHTSSGDLEIATTRGNTTNVNGVNWTITFTKEGVSDALYYYIEAYLNDSNELVDKETINFTYKGRDGIDGDGRDGITYTPDVRYKEFNSDTVLPSVSNISAWTGDLNPINWGTTSPNYERGKVVYRAERFLKIRNGQEVDTPTEWTIIRISGYDGISIFGAVYNDSTTKPEKPSGSNPPSSFNDVENDVPYVGWHRDFTEHVIWMSVFDGESYSEPIKIVGEDGLKIKLSGTVNSLEELYALTGMSIGDAYTVNGMLYVYTGIITGNDHGWQLCGNIKGEPGKDLHLHIKYSHDGQTFSDNNGETPDDYIGLYADANIQDPDTTLVPASMYTWTYVKGEQGPPGADGTSVENVFFRTTDLIDFASATWTNSQVVDYTPEVTVGNTSYQTTDNPQGVDSTYKYEWVMLRTSYYETISNEKVLKWNNFTKPQTWSHFGVDGQDGVGLEYIYYKVEAGGSIPTEINVWSGEVDSNQQSGSHYQEDDYVPTDPTGWTDNPPEIHEGDTVYYSTRVRRAITINDINAYKDRFPAIEATDSNNNMVWLGKVRWLPFSTPQFWNRYTKDGKDGDNGRSVSTTTTIETLYIQLVNLPSIPNIPGAITNDNLGLWSRSIPNISSTLPIWEARRNVTTTQVEGESPNITYGLWIILLYNSTSTITITNALYSDSDTLPEAPTGNWESYSNSTGIWHKDLTVTTRWMSMKYSNGTWSIPILISGKDGISIDLSTVTVLTDIQQLEGIQEKNIGDLYIIDGNLWIYTAATGTLHNPVEDGDVYEGFLNTGRILGANGKDAVIHIKYSNNPTPTGYSAWQAAAEALKQSVDTLTQEQRDSCEDPIFTLREGEDFGDWLGIYADTIQADPSTNYLDDNYVGGNQYHWSYTKGQQGDDGADGKSVENAYYRTNTFITNWELAGYLVGNNRYTYYNQADLKFYLELSFVNPVDLNDEVLPIYRINNTETTVDFLDNPQGVTDNLIYEYQTQRRLTRVGNTLEWQPFCTPSIWAKWGENGRDGAGIEYIFCISNNSTNPTNDIDAINNVYTTTLATAGNARLEWQDDDLYPQAGFPNSTNPITFSCIWYDNPPTNTLPGNIIYCSQRKKTYVDANTESANYGKPDNTSTTFAWTKFSTPSVWSYYGKDAQHYSIDFNANVILDDNTINSADIKEASLTTPILKCDGVAVSGNILYSAAFKLGNIPTDLILRNNSNNTLFWLDKANNNVTKLNLGSYTVIYSAIYNGITYTAELSIGVYDINNGATYRFDVSPRLVNIDEIDGDVTFYLNLKLYFKGESTYVQNNTDVCYFKSSINGVSTVLTNDSHITYTNGDNPVLYTITKNELLTYSNFSIIAYETDGNDYIDEVPILIYKNGNNSVIVDFENEMESIIYDEKGVKIGSSVSTAISLYDGGFKKNNNKFTITSISETNCTASFDDTNKTITVNSLTSDKGSVRVTILYNSNYYYATWTVTKLINTNKYQLLVSPSSINYNISTHASDASNAVILHIDVLVQKTTPSGNISTITAGEDNTILTYEMKGGLQETSASSSGVWKFSGVDITKGYLEDMTFKLLVIKLKNAAGKLLDVETLPVNYLTNGANGTNPITIQLDNDSFVLDDNVVSSVSSNISKTNVYIYDGNTEIKESDLSSNDIVTASLDENLKEYFNICCVSRESNNEVSLYYGGSLRPAYIKPKSGAIIRPVSGFITYYVKYNNFEVRKKQAVLVLDISDGSSYKLTVTPNVIALNTNENLDITLLKISDDTSVDDDTTIITQGVTLSDTPTQAGEFYYVTKTVNTNNGNGLERKAAITLYDTVDGLAKNYIYKAYRGIAAEGFEYDGLQYIVGKFTLKTIGGTTYYTTAIKSKDSNNNLYGYVALALTLNDVNLSNTYMEAASGTLRNVPEGLTYKFISGINSYSAVDTFAMSSGWLTGNPDYMHGKVTNENISYATVSVQLLDSETVGVALKGADGSSATSGITVTTNFDTPIIFDDDSTNDALAVYKVEAVVQKNGILQSGYAVSYNVEFTPTQQGISNPFEITGNHNYVQRTLAFSTGLLPEGKGKIKVTVTNVESDADTNVYETSIPIIVQNFNNGEAYNLTVYPNYIRKHYDNANANFVYTSDETEYRITASKNNGKEVTPIINYTNTNADRVVYGYFNQGTISWNNFLNNEIGVNNNNVIVIPSEYIQSLVNSHSTIYIGIIPKGLNTPVRADAIAVFRGAASYLSTVFRWSIEPLTIAPEGGSFDSPYPTLNNGQIDTTWHDGIPARPSLEHRLYCSDKRFYAEESGIEDPSWSVPRVMLDIGEWYDVEFSNKETKPDIPSSTNTYQVNDHEDPTGTKCWYDPTLDYTNITPPWENMIWRAEKYTNNSWRITRIKGEKGDQGTSPSPLEIANLVESYYYEYKGDYDKNITYKVEGRKVPYVSISSADPITDDNITTGGVISIYSKTYYYLDPEADGATAGIRNISPSTANNGKWIIMGVSSNKVEIFNDVIAKYILTNLVDTRGLLVRGTVVNTNDNSETTYITAGANGGKISSSSFNDFDNTIMFWAGSRYADNNENPTYNDIAADAKFKVYGDGRVIAQSFNGFGSFNGNFAGSSVTVINTQNWSTYVDNADGRNHSVLKTNLCGNLVLIESKPDNIDSLHLACLVPERGTEDSISYLPDVHYTGHLSVEDLLTLTDRQITIINHTGLSLNIYGCLYLKANENFYNVNLDASYPTNYHDNLLNFGLCTYKYIFADLTMNGLQNKPHIAIFPQYQYGFVSGTMFTTQQELDDAWTDAFGDE